MNAIYVQMPSETGEGVRCLGAVVADGRELPIVLGTKYGSSRGAANALKYRTLSPSLELILFLTFFFNI